jgi:hypothetical protein
MALSFTSMVLAVCTEFCKSLAYNLNELPQHDWPYAEIVYVVRDGNDVLGSSREARVIAMNAPEDHYAWRNLRPTVTIFALGTAVLSCVTLIIAVVGLHG